MDRDRLETSPLSCAVPSMMGLGPTGSRDGSIRASWLALFVLGEGRRRRRFSAIALGRASWFCAITLRTFVVPGSFGGMGSAPGSLAPRVQRARVGLRRRRRASQPSSPRRRSR